MATTAQLDLSVWRNDDTYEKVLRIVGPDLTGVAMRAQIRLTPDTPGAALVSLEVVTNPNAQGIRLAGVTSAGGVYTNDVRIRINKSTRQGLPYSGEIGNATLLAWAMMIGGRTRLVGNVRMLAHAIDSDAAPLNRNSGGATTRPRMPAGGTTLTIASDDTVTLVLDGADFANSAKEAAEAARDGAEDAQEAAELAAATALASSRYFTSRALGEAGSTTGQVFSTDDGAGNLIFYKKTGGGSAEIGRALTPAALGATGGAAMVGTALAASGAVARTQADKNTDTIDVWDFMTPAMKASVIARDLTVDTAPAFQAALDFASGKPPSGILAGRRVTFRGGFYLWATPVVFDWREAEGVIDAGDPRRPCLEGDSDSNTVIFYTGSSATPALTIEGHVEGANGGVDLFLKFRNFWLRRWYDDAGTGIGIRLDKCSYIAFESVAMDQFDTNLDCIDTIRLHASDCRITGANKGVHARVLDFAHPNVFEFDRCDFGGNFKNAALLVTPANVKFDTCCFEGCGDGTKSGSGAADVVRIEGGPHEGGCAVVIDNCYFENNNGRSDVYLNWTSSNNSGSADIRSNTFQRTDSLAFTDYNVLISAEPPSAGKLRLNVTGNGFKPIGTYTVSGSRPVVAQTVNSANALVTFTGNFFANDTERPQLNGWPAIGVGYSQLAASVRFTASGTLESEWNVASVSKTNTGTYAITYKQPLRGAGVHMSYGKIGPGVTHAYVDSETTNGCVIVTTDAAGAAADRAISLELRGLLN